MFFRFGSVFSKKRIRNTITWEKVKVDQAGAGQSVLERVEVVKQVQVPPTVYYTHRTPLVEEEHQVIQLQGEIEVADTC